MRKLTYLSTLVLMFALPWEDSISLPGIGSLARLMGFVAAAFWMGTIVLEGRFRKPNFFYALALFFFLWNFVSLFWSSDIESTMKRTKTYSQIFLLILICWETFQKPEALMVGLQAYVFGAYVLVFSTIHNYVAGKIAVEYEGRYSATGVNANDVALILILCLPMALQLILDAPKGMKGKLLQGINFMYLPLSIFSCILTGSRTSLVVIVPFAILMMITKGIRADRKLFMFFLVLIALMVGLPHIPQSLLARLGTIGSSISGADLGGRVNMWWKGTAVLAEYPILGVGSGAIDRMIGGAVHNTFITVAAETGFIGLALFLSILGLVVYEVIRLPRRASELWMTIFLIWLIGVISLSWEFRKITWILLSFMIIESSFRERLSAEKENLDVREYASRSLERQETAQPRVIW